MSWTFTCFSPPSCYSHYQYHYPSSSHLFQHLNSNRISYRNPSTSETVAIHASIFSPISPSNACRNLQFPPNCAASDGNDPSSSDVECLGTGLNVECIVSSSSESNDEPPSPPKSMTEMVAETGVLVSPFFFWGTAMVAMKEVLPLTGPFFIAAFRLIPAGLLLIAFAASKGRPFPSGVAAWLSIALFAIVDASCFQGFLAQGLQRTSAGLGSVIIDSQPLTVAILANFLFGESVGFVGASGLLLGVFGLLLLEVPALAFDGNFSLWGTGEWWMLLAAQSMAVGTVMVRWVSKYSDPVMATGWVDFLNCS